MKTWPYSLNLKKEADKKRRGVTTALDFSAANGCGDAPYYCCPVCGHDITAQMKLAEESDRLCHCGNLYFDCAGCSKPLCCASVAHKWFDIKLDKSESGWMKVEDAAPARGKRSTRGDTKGFDLIWAYHLQKLKKEKEMRNHGK